MRNPLVFYKSIAAEEQLEQPATDAQFDLFFNKLFPGGNLDFKQVLKQKAKILKIKEEAILVGKDEINKSIWFILSGLVSEVLISKEKSVPLHHYRSTEFVASVSSFFPTIRFETCLVTFKGTILLQVSEEIISELQQQFPEIREVFADLTSGRLNRHQEWNELKKLGSRKRIREFYNLYPELKDITASVYVPHNFVASYLSISLLTFTKHWREMRGKGLL